MNRLVRLSATGVLGLFCGAVVWIGSDVPAPPASETPTAFSRARVERLLDERLPCRGCHVIGGRGGRLGPDLTDVGSRMSFAQILQKIETPQAGFPDSMMPAVMMPDRSRIELAEVLAGRVHEAGGAKTEVVAPRDPSPVDGATLYTRYCAGCHGSAGAGDGSNASYLPVPPTAHADTSLMEQRSNDWLFDIISRGGYAMNRHPYMPPFGGSLTATEIREIVAHIRKLCRCVGPLWSRDSRGPAR